MKSHFLLSCLVAAPLVLASAGCSDDTSTGSGGGTTTAGGQGGTTTTGAGGGTPSLLDCTPPVGAVPALKLTPIVGGLTAGPVVLKSAPDDPARLYVVEEGGYIRVIENDQILLTPFLDVSTLIRGGTVGSEEGLLGLAFHPDYASNGRFFIHYSMAVTGDSTIFEYKRSAADPFVADPMPVQLVLQHGTDQSNHNGGSLEFGPDGYLYISLGDGGGANDPECDAQNLGNLLGKIMRLDVDATPDAGGYPAAPGNPNGGKYFHVGLRNPWKITFDGCTGDLYIGDVGQELWEEVDVAPAAGGPLNFGWPMREGAHDFANNCVNPPTNLVEPIAEFLQDGTGTCSVTGGYVYRGSKMPGLRGQYFYGDACNGFIWTLRWENGTLVDAPVLQGFTGGTISSFGQDGLGEVYVVDLGGTINRIDPM